MKKITTLALFLLIAFSNAAFAVGGRQDIIAKAKAYNDAELWACFKSTDFMSKAHCIGSYDNYDYSYATYKSHKTLNWTLYVGAPWGIRNTALSNSCKALGFKKDGRDGLNHDIYKTKRKTAHSHYEFDFNVRLNSNKKKAVVYCAEKAWDN